MGLKNRSRWERHPTNDKNGREIIIPNPTGVRLNILEAFAEHRASNGPLIADMIGTPYETVRDYIRDLFAPKNAFLDLYNQRDGTQKRWLGNNGHMWFTLSEKGYDIIRQHHAVVPHIEGNPREFPHEVGIHRTVQSIKAGIRKEGRHRLVLREEVRNHPNFVPANEKHPFSIKVARDYTFASGKKDSFNHVFRPDDFPAINYDTGAWRFIYFEYENKNTIDANSFNDVSFLEKFLALQYIIGRGLCEERWGILKEDMIALFAAPTEKHVENMKAVVYRETNGKGCDWIAFAIVPTLFQTLSITPMPLYGKWQRVGRPDLDLTQPPEE